MNVYLHYVVERGIFAGQSKLMGIYGTRKAAQAQIPKNPNTAIHDHYIMRRTVKAMP